MSVTPKEHLSGEEPMQCNDGMKETHTQSDSQLKKIYITFSLTTQQNFNFWAFLTNQKFNTVATKQHLTMLDLNSC